MTSKTICRRWLAIVASFGAALSVAHATTQTIFTDSWKATGSNNAVYTSGSFSIHFSVPLNGVDLSEADSNSKFSLSIGPDEYTTQIIATNLGNAAIYSAGKPTASFPITLQETNGQELTNGFVTVSWTATNITVTGIDSYDLLGMEANFAANYEYHDTKSPSFSLGYYEVILTLDASDNGGGTFNYDNPFVLVTGTDSQTEYKPENGSGPYYLETGSLRGEEILTPPRLAITSPPPNFKVYDANLIVNVAINASDNLGLNIIEGYVNGDTNNQITFGDFDELPTNSISWSDQLALAGVGQVGANVITIVAEDLAGNETTLSRTFLWIETNAAVVKVNPKGAGTVKGIKNGQVLQVNFGYPVSATSTNKDWIFSEWTDGAGNVLSSNASFEYFDENGTLTNSSSPTLIANFVPSPFTNTDLVGTYTGLFYDTNNGVELSDAGYITVTLTEGGNFSGKLYLANTVLPFALSGQLALTADGSNAMAELNFKVAKSEYLNVKLLLATDPNLTNAGAGTLNGLVNACSDPTETNLLDSAQIQGELSRYNTNVVPGLYNIVVSPFSIPIGPPSGVPYQGPGGYGYGTATVSKKGAVAVVMNLADGTSPAISFASSLAWDGTCPIYASLYGGKGVILGWMQFATDGSGIIIQQLHSVSWVKMPVADKYYMDGFAAVPGIFGGLYVPPKAGVNVLGWTDGTLVIDQGYSGMSLPDEVDVAVTYNPVRNTFADANKVTIALTPPNGSLRGTFYPTGGKTPFSYRGIVVDGGGFGFYLDAAKQETGPTWLRTSTPGGGTIGDGSNTGSTTTTIGGSFPTGPPPSATP
jgi:hypothetical protein